MTESLTRRTFLALTSAFVLKPKSEEAKRLACIEVQQPDGNWLVGPRSLRGVKRGQRFRRHFGMTADAPLNLEATADEDGHDGIDEDGCVCGVVYFNEDTAEHFPKEEV